MAEDIESGLGIGDCYYNTTMVRNRQYVLTQGSGVLRLLARRYLCVPSSYFP